jgi:hypothetical protein
VDCHPAERDGRTGVEFTWEGFDDDAHLYACPVIRILIDGTFEHEVHNESDSGRVLVIADIRPYEW